MKIRYSAEASEDLLATLEYLAARNSRAAETLYRDVKLTLRRIAAGELDGPETTLRTGQQVRSWPVHPFRIYYRKVDGVLHVIRLHHHARRPIEK